MNIYKTTKTKSTLIIVPTILLFILLTFGFISKHSINIKKQEQDKILQETIKKLSSTLTDPYSIKDGQIYYQNTLMEGVDVGTFEPFDLNRSFSKDKNHVYYVLNVIEGADPATFEFFYSDYWGLARDKNRVYISENVIEGADPATFEVIKGTGYFKDKSHVFVETEQLQRADPATFEPIPRMAWNWVNKKVEAVYRPYSKDKNAVYFVSAYEDDSEPKRITNSDPITFVGVKDSRGVDIYFKDKNHVYDDENGVLEDSDPNTFELLTSQYSRDTRSAYYEDERIPSVDIATFNVIGDGFAEDKKYLYENGEVIFNLATSPNPFKQAANRMRELLPKGDSALDSIVATYYELTHGYGGAYFDHDVFFLDAEKSADEFFRSFYKDLKRPEQWTLNKFPAFRLAFIAQSSPASTHELAWPTGNDSGGRMVGKKFLDENTMLAYGSYYVVAYRGSSAYICKESRINIDKFIFKKINGEWKIWEIEEGIDSWTTQNEGSTEEECEEINQDKLEKYKSLQ